MFLSMLLLIPRDIEYQYVTHPRPQGYPVFLNVIFPLTKWIGGSGDEDVCYPFRWTRVRIAGKAIVFFNELACVLCVRKVYHTVSVRVLLHSFVSSSHPLTGNLLGVPLFVFYIKYSCHGEKYFIALYQPRSQGFSLLNSKGKSPGNEVGPIYLTLSHNRARSTNKIIFSPLDWNIVEGTGYEIRRTSKVIMTILLRFMLEGPQPCTIFSFP